MITMIVHNEYSVGRCAVFVWYFRISIQEALVSYSAGIKVVATASNLERLASKATDSYMMINVFAFFQARRSKLAGLVGADKCTFYPKYGTCDPNHCGTAGSKPKFSIHKECMFFSFSENDEIGDLGGKIASRAFDVRSRAQVENENKEII